MHGRVSASAVGTRALQQSNKNNRVSHTTASNRRQFFCYSGSTTDQSSISINICPKNRIHEILEMCTQKPSKICCIFFAAYFSKNKIQLFTLTKKTKKKKNITTNCNGHFWTTPIFGLNASFLFLSRNVCFFSRWLFKELLQKWAVSEAFKCTCAALIKFWRMHNDVCVCACVGVAWMGGLYTYIFAFIFVVVLLLKAGVPRNCALM